MIKTIRIDEQNELTLSNNVGWLFEYRDQFGHDIVPDLMPVLGAILELIEGATEQGISIKEAKDAVKAISGGAATGALIELAGLQMTDVINIVWALAKAADDSIPEPKRWVRQFEIFPLDLIVPEAFTLVAQGMMSSKNWTRLQKAVGDLRAPKKKNTKKRQGSTTLSSPE